MEKPVIKSKEKASRKWKRIRRGLLLAAAVVCITACAPEMPEVPTSFTEQDTYLQITMGDRFFLWDQGDNQWRVYQLIDDDTIRSLSTGETVEAKKEGYRQYWELDDHIVDVSVSQVPGKEKTFTLDADTPLEEID